MQLGTPTEHHDLISHHIGLARRVARSVARRVPRSVDREDLEGVAMMALTEAAQRYDRDRQSSFQAYAACRIRGAVLDELRRHDPMGRRARERVKRAESMGMKVMQLRIQSLEDERVAEPAADAKPIDEQVQRNGCLAELQPAIDALPERLRRILSMYYVEERSQAEIGAELGVTESRVCQLRGQALRRLRQRMTH